MELLEQHSIMSLQEQHHQIVLDSLSYNGFHKSQNKTKNTSRQYIERLSASHAPLPTICSKQRFHKRRELIFGANV